MGLPSAKVSSKRRTRRRPGPARKVIMRSPTLGRIVFERSGKWWAVELPSIPGAYTQGKTRDEAYRNLLSLLRDLIEMSPTKLTAA